MSGLFNKIQWGDGLAVTDEGDGVIRVDSSGGGGDGTAGPPGPAGPPGATGPGVAAGGTAGQVLGKLSSTDYATSWQTPAAGVPTPVVNGQWLQGQGGAAVWAPMTTKLTSAVPAANTDIPWAAGGVAALWVEVVPAAGSSIRTYGPPPAGPGTRLSLRINSANPVGLSHNGAGAGTPLYLRGNVDTTLHTSDTIEFIYETPGPYWVEVNRSAIADADVPSLVYGQRLSPGGAGMPSNDCNLAVENGWYLGQPGTANAPAGSDYFAMTVVQVSGPGQLRQIAYAYSSDTIWMRRLQDGTTWFPWVKTWG